jgi:peptide/nickel transport system ATP-binding protein/oligopeptide transport system ATP-binding protein
MTEKLIEAKGLRTTFYTERGRLDAIDGIDFYIKKGETLGVVGESGCGKTVTALSLLKLIAYPPGRITGGEVWFEGEDILRKPEAQMKSIRGNKISMIFQEPMTSLNPLFTVGYQIGETLRIHKKLKAAEARERAVELVKLVGIPCPDKIVDDYPHQLSGGMRQRIMIATALACDPSLLIADEPTTALDVSIQAQILELMRELKEKLGTSIMMITHNLGVIAEVADRVIVMYAGQIVEHSPVRDLFKKPLHPYTEGLLKSIPRIDRGNEKIEPIRGMVPDLINPPKGCRFAPRCDYKKEVCIKTAPDLVSFGEREVRCLKYQSGVYGSNS